jgi:hypothetical protein
MRWLTALITSLTGKGGRFVREDSGDADVLTNEDANFDELRLLGHSRYFSF